MILELLVHLLLYEVYLFSSLVILEEAFLVFLTNLLYEESLALFFSGCIFLGSFFLLKDTFNSFDFHHLVETLLIVKVVVFKLLILFDLLISDSVDFSNHHPFVHLFNFVQLLIKKHL